MDLCHAVGDARKYWRISEEIVAILVRALWKRWRMSEGRCWDERGSVLVVLLLCHRGDQCCLGEITADVLMTHFICVLASDGFFDNSG
jgi:hypothetical protein